MNEHDDVDLEQLLSELAPTPEQRAELLEAHRLLEHGLSRLADPLPPPDFFHGVMAKVAAQPARSFSRADWGVGLAMLVAVLGGGLGLVAMNVGGLHGVGLLMGRLALAGHQAGVGVATVMEALWRTAAIPVVVALSATALTSMAALRRWVWAQ